MTHRVMPALLWGTLIVASCRTPAATVATAPEGRKPAHRQEQTAPEASEAQQWFARYQEPCGRSLLEISATPDGPFTLVQPKGQNHPARRLLYDVLIGKGGFIITGHLSDDHVEDDHCGSYRVLVVESFAPWGPVRRVFSMGALDGQLHRYTEHLPTDRYVAEDFAGDDTGRLLNSDACVELAASACLAPRVVQTNADGRVLCCPFL